MLSEIHQPLRCPPSLFFPPSLPPYLLVVVEALRGDGGDGHQVQAKAGQAVEPVGLEPREGGREGGRKEGMRSALRYHFSI